MPPSLNLRLALLLVIAVSALVAPPRAAAHLRSGLLAVDYRASVVSAPPALSVRIYESDRAVALMPAPGQTVIVRGYLGEPFVRIDKSGTEVNAASLTATGFGLLGETERRAGWIFHSRSRVFVWHDRRLRGLPQGVHKGVWRIPLTVDGQPTSASGVLERVRRPQLWQWAILGLAFAAPFAFARVRRNPDAAVVFGLTSATSVLVVSAGFALDRYASTGKWSEFAIEVFFTLIGIGFIVAGSRQARAVAGGALGLLGFAVGLSVFPVLRHGFVLSGLPWMFVRLLVVLSISAGAVATALGLLAFNSAAQFDA
jgi:hypothetical protein